MRFGLRQTPVWATGQSQVPASGGRWRASCRRYSPITRGCSILRGGAPMRRMPRAPAGVLPSKVSQNAESTRCGGRMWLPQMAGPRIPRWSGLRLPGPGSTTGEKGHSLAYGIAGRTRGRCRSVKSLNWQASSRGTPARRMTVFLRSGRVSVTFRRSSRALPAGYAQPQHGAIPRSALGSDRLVRSPWVRVPQSKPVVASGPCLVCRSVADRRC
jgi:hypothetical protein